jgi:uncharacterized membrane protein
MEDYVKTGEDKQFEYYRNDSEVLSGDGEEEPYEELYNQKENFNVKVSDQEITIKKRTVDKIMILSDSQPTEQILFSLYKTVNKGESQDQIKTQLNSTERIRPNNPNDLDSLRGSEAVAFPNMASPDNDINNINAPTNGENKEEAEPQPIISGGAILRSSPPQENEKTQFTVNTGTPLSGEMMVIGTGDNPNGNSNVLNVPSSEGSDNEEGAFKKEANINNLNVGLPPQAVKTKWFYLLLALVGIAELVLFIISLLSGVGIFLLFLVGAVLLFTGIFGFMKINNKIYNDKILYICTIASMVMGILGIFFALMSPAGAGFFVIALILGCLSAVFSVFCIIWTKQLKSEEDNNKQKQMELLVDDKK